MTWYTYVYCNPLKPSTLHECGFEPFYVGKGEGNRSLAHLIPSRLRGDPNKHKVNTIRKILREGCEPLIMVNSTMEVEDDAYADEIRLIALYGRADLGLGPLTNMTDGGEGRTAGVVTTKTRELLSIKTGVAHADGKLVKNTAAWSTAGLAKAHSPEGRARSAFARTGATRSLDTCQKLSEARIKFINGLSEAERKLKLGTMRGKHHTEEAKRKSRDNNPRTMRVEVLGITYPSLNAAVRATGINKPKLKTHQTFRVIA